MQYRQEHCMPHFIYLRKKIKSKLFLGKIIAPHGFLNYCFILLLPMCTTTISRVSHLHWKIQFCCSTNHTFPALSMARRSLSSLLWLPATLHSVNTFLALCKEVNSKVHISLNRLLSFHFVQRGLLVHPFPGESMQTGWKCWQIP